jgi:hypothetical protein
VRFYSEAERHADIGASAAVQPNLMTTHMRKLFASALLFAVAAWTPTTRAEAVLDWNAIATQAIIAAGRPGPSLAIDLAVVHAGIHDAVQAYDKTYEPYATDLEGAGSPAAAVAKATRDILVNRFPSQAGAIDTAYNNYFTANSIPFDDPGVAVGAAAAAGMIALRTGDGAFPSPAPVFVGANIVGMWRPTPSLLPGPPASFSSMAAPWLADVAPFVTLTSDQFLNDKLLVLGTPQYRKDYNEVKALGSRFSTQRTPEQTQIAYFWADNFFAQMNRTLRGLAEAYVPDAGDRARMFALVYLSSADAVINTWASKVTFPTWRPITAINQGNSDPDPRTIGDTAWQPLINTPNYPDHSSGANAFVGGSMKMLSLIFGTDDVTFTVTSLNPNANPTARTYTRFSAAAEDVVEARVLQGIHFRTADFNGRKLGKNVAKWVFKHALRPLNDDTDPDEDDGTDD